MFDNSVSILTSLVSRSDNAKLSSNNERNGTLLTLFLPCRAVNNPVKTLKVKVYDEQYHFQHASDMTKEMYNNLRNSIFSLEDDIVSKPMKKYIAFIRKTNFIDIVLRKSNLTLYINLKKGSLNDPKKIARDVSNIGHWGNGNYEIKLVNLHNLSYILTLIKQSYDNN